MCVSVSVFLCMLDEKVCAFKCVGVIVCVCVCVCVCIWGIGKGLGLYV